MSVFLNLDCLSLVVCSNTTLLKLQTVLFLFFSKFCASKSGVRLIYGCGLYTDVYGKLEATKVEGWNSKAKILQVPVLRLHMQRNVSWAWFHMGWCKALESLDL